MPGMGEELVGLWDAVPGTGVELVSGFAVIVLIDTTVLVGADRAMLAALVFVFVANLVPTKVFTDLSIASFVVVTMSSKSPQVDLLINDLKLESPSRTPAKLPPVKMVENENVVGRWQLDVIVVHSVSWSFTLKER